MPVIGQPAGGENLEAQARLRHLANHLGHPQRVGGEKRVADLKRNDRIGLLHLLGRASEVVEAVHEEVVFPALVGHTLDAVGIVGRHTGQHAGVVHPFHKIVNLAASAFPEELIGSSAVVDDCNRFCQADHLVDRHLSGTGRMQAEELHLGSPVACGLEHLGHLLRLAELVGIDAGRFATRKIVDDPVGREILLHVLVHVGAQVRIAADLVPTGHQPRDAMVAQLDRGQPRGGLRLRLVASGNSTYRQSGTSRNG